MNKYLYFKSKYLEYKTKRARGTTGSTGTNSEKKFKSVPISNLSNIFKLEAEKDNLEPEPEESDLDQEVASVPRKKSITLSDIKKLFTTSDLALKITEEQASQMIPTEPTKKAQEAQVRKSSRIQERSVFSTPGFRSNSDYIYNYKTPMLFTPRTLALLSSPLGKDNDAIEALQANQEELDPEYVDYEGNYGKIVETWFADTYPCVCCGARNSLARYSSDIFPVIDLVCTNPAHQVQTHGVRYFQIKASNGLPFAGDKYFDLDGSTRLDPGHIYTGSKRVGLPVHGITGESDPADKEFLIGYICVQIKPIEPDDQTITIQSIGCVLPRVNNNFGSYYSYVSGTIKPKITWETDNVEVKKIRLRSRHLIPRDYLSTNFYQISPNPLSQNPGFRL